MKKILLTFGLFLVLLGAIYLIQNYSKNGGNLSLFKKTSTVTINKNVFKVTVASTQQQREIGLSETKSISQDQGMIFLFDKADYYSFWMKNMKFPIDIIYINNDTIVTIRENATPLKNTTDAPIIYTSSQPANKILEISAGLSEKFNFKNGDKVTYENIGN